MCNALGQAAEVGATAVGGTRQKLLSSATYYPFGPSAGWSYGNGRPMQRVLDQDYRPQVIQDSRSDGLNIGFAFDPVGNLTVLTAPGNTAPVVSLGYDNLDRLTAFKDGPTGTVIDGYSYDATGNRLSAQVNGSSQTYSYPTDSHRLTGVAGAARSYDAAGNTTAIDGTTREFAYDATGRLSQAKRSGTLAMEYRYNDRGEQVRRFLGTTNTYTVYDEAGHWLGDYDGNGKALQQAIWLDDLPVGVLAGTALNYVQPDHLGAPRTVIDPARDVAIWTWDIKGEAFGNTPPDQDADRDGTAFVFGMRLPGQRYDSATGLNQNYFRDYDTSSGRYGQSDPIGMAAGNSTFAYVEARPLVAKDVYGLQSSSMVGSEAARAIGPYAARNADGVTENDIPVSRLFDWDRNEARPTVEVPLDEKILSTLYDASQFGMMSRVGGFVGAKLNNVNNQCAEDDELRKNCQALKDSILNTCYGLSPRKRMACYEAANTSYRQCMGYE